MATAKTYRCGCGEWMGEACEWTGPASEMVVVEYMPQCWRSSHAAARNSGVYPHNGSVRVACCRECADLLMQSEGDPNESPDGCDFASITDHDPTDYTDPTLT